MDGTGRTHRVTERRAHCLVGDIAQHHGLVALTGVVDLGRRRHVELEPRVGGEDARLTRRLVRPDSPQLRGSVGGQQKQGHPGVVGLKDGGREVCDRGAGRANDSRRHP